MSENIAPQVLLTRSLALSVFYAKQNYYNGFATISDEQYDVLEESLKSVCRNHPLITHGVGTVDDTYLLGIVELSYLIRNPKFTIADDDKEPIVTLLKTAREDYIKRNKE